MAKKTAAEKKDVNSSQSSQKFKFSKIEID